MSYPHVQWLRALDALRKHPDPAVRAAAAERAAKWERVIAGMAGGALQIGSRTPVAGAPAWATPEVVHGGFATGRLLAEQPLSDDERATLAALPDDAPGDSERERVNLDAVGDAGRARLLAALRDGRLRIDLPEHGALVVVAWLIEQGDAAAGLALLEDLGPWLGRLRFTPTVTDTPRPEADTAHVATVGQVARKLAAARPQRRVVAMNETLSVWRPLQDDLVALFLDADDGGEGWTARATDLLARCDRALADHPGNRRPVHPKSNLGRLIRGLREAVGGDLGAIARLRGVLANHVTRYGRPGTTSSRERREAAEALARRPLFATLRHLLAERMGALDAEGGLPDLDAVLGPVQPSEAVEGRPEGARLAAAIGDALLRCYEAPIDELVELGVVGSSEVLATVLPQVTAQVRASGFAEADLRRLYGGIYRAFRRRRGLLLLDLAHQVRMDELPWVAALEALRAPGTADAEVARRTVQQVVLLALHGFPHTILPNPLVSELRGLAKQAGVQVPLVEEIAADIFTGALTLKYAEAAEIAARELSGTLYARYFDLPDPASLHEVGVQVHGKATAPRFVELCRLRAVGPEQPLVIPPHVLAERAREVERSRRYPYFKTWVASCDLALDLDIEGLPHPDDAPVVIAGERRDAGFVRDLRGWTLARERTGKGVAFNGALLEQGQIVTTHNLMPLIAAFDLRPQLKPLLPGMIDDAFDYVLTRLGTLDRAPRHARLRGAKNAAYAWRQLILFLSLAEPAVVDAFVAGARGRVRDLEHPLGGRFARAWRGLLAVREGARFDANDEVDGGRGRRLVGWSAGAPHWLLP